ncbi:unnamed protein product [Knipowitschia caucasica]|uniref:Uncharacterized protein n=1 Tax=Knipowitschia caucasica TaxID=637954 RepID=A0AAV2KH42_KNICA
MTAQPEEDPSPGPEPDSFGEPLYEEVGDFGLQVLQSLQTSFRSSIAAETHEVSVHPPVVEETGSCDEDPSDAPSSPSSEELLLKELETALGGGEEPEEAGQRTVEDEGPYDV